jgi:uncharacterized zinc-type alcohol dehydrogenase-like protein
MSRAPEELNCQSQSINFRVHLALSGMVRDDKPGRAHELIVGAVLEPIPVAAFSLIIQQRSLSGSLAGSPVAIETMLDFAARHNIAPQTEHFPMSKINEAFARLARGLRL